MSKLDKLWGEKIFYLGLVPSVSKFETNSTWLYP